jgi:dTDP-4-dehydrorhamnose reductase
MIIGVTGANGQLGCSIRKIAAETPHTFIFSDLPELDITDKASVERWITHNGITLIVNCAAYTAVDRAESEPDAAWRVNALGPQVLAEVCAGRGLGLIHVSTDYVFDGTAQTPYTEENETHPLGVYGATKRQGEVAIEQSGCRARIVRTSWLHSEFGRNFVKTMLRLGAEKERLAVVDDQYGSPTYAPNLARAILHLATDQFTGFDICHYCDAGVTTWYDFARTIFRLTGNPIPVDRIATADFPTAAKRPAYSVLDTAKIRRQGVTTPDWREALKECLKNIR